MRLFTVNLSNFAVNSDQSFFALFSRVDTSLARLNSRHVQICSRMLLRILGGLVPWFQVIHAFLFLRHRISFSKHG